MRQRAGVIGQRLDIEKQRVRHMAGAVLRGHIAQGLLSGGRHAGVDNLDLRVINMFRQPVGGDKNEVDIGASVLLFMTELSAFYRVLTS